MTPQEALKNIAVAIVNYRGTLQEHVILQESLKTLEQAILPVKPDASPTSKND